MKRYFEEERYESIYEEDYIAKSKISRMGTTLRSTYEYKLYQSQTLCTSTYYDTEDYSNDYYCNIKAYRIA